jgi:formylmethanofuran dehydrogenase subunit D
MTKVYFKGCGALYLIGKVRKNYNIGDTLKLKSQIGKSIVVNKKQNEIHIKPINWEIRLKKELGIYNR